MGAEALGSNRCRRYVTEETRNYLLQCKRCTQGVSKTFSSTPQAIVKQSHILDESYGA